jgi:hypothetical protein
MIVRSSRLWVGFILLVGLTAFGFAPTARAADAPPQTRAARLTIAQGSVTVTDPNNAAGFPGQVNLPLLSGVQVATGSDGQAEIEFEDGSVVRLTPNSTLSLDNLMIGSDGVFVTDLSLLRGLAYCELRATQQYGFMLNAGGDILSPIENTTVRVNFDQAPASFAVMDGTAQIERQGGAAGGYQAQVRAGESLQSDVTDASRYFLTQGIAADSWDQWNQDLDQSAAAASSSSTSVRDDYAGADGYGWSDLDANGSWYNVPGEGQVWQPNVAETDADFDPYGNGAWVYYGGTGYVWASGYAWGWTPYRCGNWSYYNGFGWGWAPGAGCGGGGWGFNRGGNQVNIGRYPSGYHPIRVPTPRPGPLRPILPVRPYSVAQVPHGPSQPQRGSQVIDGHTVSRISPVRGTSNPGGAATGSSLRRDFPINPANHSHDLGLQSTTPAVARPSPAQGQPGRQMVPANGGPSSQPAYGNRGQGYPANGVNRPLPTNRPALNTPPASLTPAPAEPQRNVPSAPPQYQPGQRAVPPGQQAAPPQQPAPPQRYENQRPPEHPTYNPPPQQQQRYESRPPAEHPSYSPPPQQQSRPSPPQEPSRPAPPQPSHTESAPPAQPTTPSQPHNPPK